MYQIWHVLIASFLWLAAAPIPASMYGQDGSEGVWPAVLKTLKTATGPRLTLSKAKEQSGAFFPHSWLLYRQESEWSAHFQADGKPVSAAGKTLNLHGKAKLGDIVLVEAEGMKSVVLVYAGERAFNDAPATQLS